MLPFPLKRESNRIISYFWIPCFRFTAHGMTNERTAGHSITTFCKTISFQHETNFIRNFIWIIPRSTVIPVAGLVLKHFVERGEQVFLGVNGNRAKAVSLKKKCGMKECSQSYVLDPPVRLVSP